MATASEIVLEYVCPSLGLLMANLMFLAPLKDLQSAVTKGAGLGDLNPTPWAFMLGNCLGWTTYGVLINNWFVFWANYPGFLIACWLNLGAVKLLYSHHHQAEARRSLVDFLSSSAAVAEAMEKGSMRGETSSQLLRDNVDEELEKNSLLCDAKSKNGVKDVDVSETAATSAVENGEDETFESQNTDGQPEQHRHDWAKIVWDVTSQTTPAKTPHERLVVGIILVWTVVLSAIGFYKNYASSNSDNTSDVAQSIVGYIVNGNLIFFYGAPLSEIHDVLKTRQSKTLHLPTMVMNTSNAIFWTAYALAPQINDAFIYVPNGLGVILGTIQFILFLMFPRNKQKDETGQEFPSRSSDT